MSRPEIFGLRDDLRKLNNKLQFYAVCEHLASWKYGRPT